jgi:hypothetical protein
MLLVGVVVAASSQPNNLRGGIKGEDGYDFIDFDISTIDFDNLRCDMLGDERPNIQCVHQGKDCAAEGKKCYVVGISNGPYYGCGDPDTCDDPNDRSSSQTTTTSTTTPACLPVNATGCSPNPHYAPNCCAGSECKGVPGSGSNGSSMVFKCFGLGDMMDGGQLVE